MQIQRALALLAAAPLFLSACSSSSSTTTSLTEPSSTTSTTEARVASTTTMPDAVTTTTSEAVEILLPANDVDDPMEAIAAIFEYVSYLATTPDRGRELLGYAYAESCDCYERLLTDFETYVENGWIQDDDGIQVTQIRVSQEFTDSVLLEVTYSWSPQYVLAADGEVVRLLDDEWTDRVSLIGLELGSDRRWRVGVIGIVGETP